MKSKDLRTSSPARSKAASVSLVVLHLPHAAASISCCCLCLTLLMQQGLKKETEKSSVLRTDNTNLQDEIRELKKQLKPIDPNKALQVSCAA